MIRKKISLADKLFADSGPIIVDLTGPEGNAYYLLGLAKTLSKQLYLNYEEIASQMMSGDYENLINVFDEHFGTYVILER